MPAQPVKITKAKLTKRQWETLKTIYDSPYPVVWSQNSPLNTVFARLERLALIERTPLRHVGLTNQARDLFRHENARKRAKARRKAA